MNDYVMPCCMFGGAKWWDAWRTMSVHIEHWHSTCIHECARMTLACDHLIALMRFTWGSDNNRCVWTCDHMRPWCVLRGVVNCPDACYAGLCPDYRKMTNLMRFTRVECHEPEAFYAGRRSISNKWTWCVLRGSVKLIIASVQECKCAMCIDDA